MLETSSHEDFVQESLLMRSSILMRNKTLRCSQLRLGSNPQFPAHTGLRFAVSSGTCCLSPASKPFGSRVWKEARRLSEDFLNELWTQNSQLLHRGLDRAIYFSGLPEPKCLGRALLERELLSDGYAEVGRPALAHATSTSSRARLYLVSDLTLPPCQF